MASPGATIASRFRQVPVSQKIAIAAAIGLGILLALTRDLFVLVLLLPVFVGLLFPLFRRPGLLELAGRLDQAVDRGQARTQAGSGTFNRFFRRPLYVGLAKLRTVTAKIPDEYVRSGLQATLSLYFVGVLLAVFAALLYAALVAVLFILVLAMIGFAFWIASKLMGWSEGSTASASWFPLGGGGGREQNPYAAKAVYKPGLFFDDLLARIDEEGRILKPGALLDTPTGYRIQADGIYKEGLISDEMVAEIDADGRICRPGFLSTSTGYRIDEGRIVKEGLLLDEEVLKLKDDN